MALLEEHGPNLAYPYSSAIKGSRHGNMRELRVQSKGRPFRVCYAFDPRRNAILQLIPIADRLYDKHLLDIKGDSHG